MTKTRIRKNDKDSKKIKKQEGLKESKRSRDNKKELQVLEKGQETIKRTTCIRRRSSVDKKKE